MGEINQALGVYGAGHQFTIGGKEYTLAPVHQRTKADFEAWMEAEARKDVYAEREHMDPEAFACLVSKFVKEKSGGVYSWMGEQFRRVYPTVPGMVRLFYLLTRKFHPDLLPDALAPVVEEHLGDVVDAVCEVLALGKLLPSKPSPKQA